MTNLTSDNCLGALSGPGKKVVKFTAGWCGQCRALAPIIDELEEEHNDMCVFYSADAEECGDAAEKYNIRSLPTILMMSGGDVLWKNAGMISKAGLEGAFAKYIAN